MELLDRRLILRLLFGRPGHVRRPLIFLILIGLAASLASGHFLTLRNIIALLTSTSFLIVASVGEAFVVMVGMIDLGVESLLAASGMFLAWLFVMNGVAGGPALLATLALGTLVGCAVGLLVARGRIPSFIVTLGTYWGLRGIALLFNGGNYISPDTVQPAREFSFGWIAGTFHGVPTLILLALAMVVGGQALMSFTPAGPWIKATGSNEDAARAVGLRTDLVKLSVLAISGFSAAMAGIMITTWQDSVYPLTGQGYSLEAIAAVILGGIPFTGGRGTIVGAAIGALVIGVINDVIVLVGLPALYEYIFVACILVLAGLQARGAAAAK
jgi:ribose transport system permease protein